MRELSQARSEMFLKMYRVLEGALEKRYGSNGKSSSVVMEYLRDDDSEPYRYQLNVCREIRNLLSHNSDESGEPVVEPSEAVLESLLEIVNHVTRPRLAIEYGTPFERILCAHANDYAFDVMHRMEKLGYSHVPVMEKGKITGVFSSGSLFGYLEKYGLDALRSDARIGQLKDQLDIQLRGARRYLFMPEDATIIQVRNAFEMRHEKNARTSVVFITKKGTQDEPLLAMLTPWDALEDKANGG